MVIRPDKKTLAVFLGSYVAAQAVPGVGEEVRDLLLEEPPQFVIADTIIRPYYRNRGDIPFVPAGEALDFDDDGIMRMANMFLASGQYNGNL